MSVRGGLQRLDPAMVDRQKAATMLNSEEIIRLLRYSLRPSLACPATSEDHRHTDGAQVRQSALPRC